MKVRVMGAALLLVGVAACGSDAETVPVAESAPAELAVASPAEMGAPACEPVLRMPLDGRASAYDSVAVELGGAAATLCYGRPEMRGREIFGALVPYDTLWRTGANEPTTIHLPFPAQIAGLTVEPGSYTLYTVPGAEEWQVIVNRSTSQWGIETSYTDEIRAQEVGRATVPAGQTAEAVERFTITTVPAGPNSAELVLEWENTRVEVPVTRL